ncbi:Hypothetical protein D9617_17g047340 [Elsinoe fawcettii]|nr:Hypothetical protein D9617_17g047340 [Elsinoe fawcettii]
MQSAQIPGLSLGIPGISYQAQGSVQPGYIAKSSQQNVPAVQRPASLTPQPQYDITYDSASNASAFTYNQQQSSQLPQDQFPQSARSDLEDGELSDALMSDSSSEPSVATGQKRKAREELAGPLATRPHTSEGTTYDLAIRGAAQLSNYEKRNLLILSALLRESSDPDALMRRLLQTTYQIRDHVQGGTHGVQPPAAQQGLGQVSARSTADARAPSMSNANTLVVDISSRKTVATKPVPQDRSAYLARLQELKSKKSTTTTPVQSAVKKPNVSTQTTAKATALPTAISPAAGTPTAAAKFTPKPDMNAILAKKLAALRAERAAKLAAEKLAAQKLSADIDQLIESAPRSTNGSKPSTPSVSSPSLLTPPLPSKNTRNRPSAAELNESDMDLYGGTPSDSNRPSPYWQQQPSSEHYDSVVIEASSSEDEEEEPRNVQDMERDIEKIKAEIRAREAKKRQALTSASPLVPSADPSQVVEVEQGDSQALIAGKHSDQGPATATLGPDERNAMSSGENSEASSAAGALVSEKESVDGDADKGTLEDAASNVEEKSNQGPSEDVSTQPSPPLLQEQSMEESGSSSGSDEDESDDPEQEAQSDSLSIARPNGTNDVANSESVQNLNANITSTSSAEDEPENGDSDAMDISSDDASDASSDDDSAGSHSGDASMDLEDSAQDDEGGDSDVEDSSSVPSPVKAASGQDTRMTSSGEISEEEDDEEYEPAPYVERDPSLSPIGSGSPPPDWQRPQAAFPASNNVIIRNESGSADDPTPAQQEVRIFATA